ncbi:AAA family ATPase [Steroidobacter sp. S1-65]|uniref:non-specific protein-tyrosine kinase n=1 Tax=Steroidobacter gossypii TaxID=2805490 RepID=A0ABS1WZ48_9GAMM|nr:AAA family ATPase [Steroidobacter gossypii]MBM0106197.1 AAA family ATPase [Steroidobacter gossypii]
MSLVERALKKIQESRGQTPTSVPHAGASTITLDLTPRAVPPPVVTQAVNVARVAPRPEPARPSQVVHIDREALRHAELLPPLSQERQLAGEYRHIKRPLIANALGRGVPKLPQGHRIMIASAMPGDGKTFTSINLALSFALEKDLSVVLVDADVAKAHLSRTFRVHNNPGLMDLLRDESMDAESVILPTDVPGLSLLPAGKSSDTAAELLASSRMEQIASEITAREPNRIVLFDSSPLLVTSEAISLSGMVGQIVLVVRAGMTAQSAVLDAIDLLGEGKSIGLVLNQTDEPVRPGYYYRYSYEQGRAEGEGDLTDDIPAAGPRGEAG